MPNLLSRRDVLIGAGAGAALFLAGCSGGKSDPTPTTEKTIPKFPIKDFVFVNFSNSLGVVGGIESFYDLHNSSLVRWGVEFDGITLTEPFVDSEIQRGVIPRAKSSSGLQRFDVVFKDTKGNPLTDLGLVTTSAENGAGDLFINSYPFDITKDPANGPIRAEPATEDSGSEITNVVVERRIEKQGDRILITPANSSEVYLTDDQGNFVQLDPTGPIPKELNGWKRQLNDNGDLQIVREINPSNVPLDTTFKGAGYYATDNMGSAVALVGLPW